MKKQHLVRYFICALLYLLILWIANKKDSAPEVQLEEVTKVIDSGLEKPETIVPN